MQIQEDGYKHRGMRKKLVKLLEKKGITDINVLNALGKVPRHYFFDNVFVEHAYQDKAFPIGEGQTISQPYTVAIQTELLEVKPGDCIHSGGYELLRSPSYRGWPRGLAAPMGHSVVVHDSLATQFGSALQYPSALKVRISWR